MKKMMFFLTLLSVIGASAAAGTVAYWRFEQGPAYTNVIHNAASGVYSADIPDVSGNGNHLAVWNSSQWQYRANVPYATVPWTGAANNFSIKNITGSPTLWTTTLRNWEPAQWTIEVTFKAEAGGWKTIVGRDSYGSLTSGTEVNPALAGLYLQTTDNPAMGLAIKFVDRAGYWHSAELGNAYVGFNYSTDPDGNTAPWYTVAAVSDGRYLRLYRYSHATPEKGYELIAETDMTVVNPGSTDTALDGGAGSGSDWQAGNITVGRGMYNGSHTDRFYGYIDEVRISDRALSPQEFLLAEPFVKPYFPSQDEYLPSTSAIAYSWQTAIPSEKTFGSYTIYIADNPSDLMPSVPTTYMHKATVTNKETTSYAGYTGTYAYGQDYYWRIDLTTLEPNYLPDPNNPVYNIPVVYEGWPVRFFGPRACPGLTISGNVSIMPDPIDHSYAPADAVFTVTINRGTINNSAIAWYKVNGAQDNLETPDPLDPADIKISNVPGVTEITYNPDLPTATQTTLRIVAADPADNGLYYARVRLADPLGGVTGCEANSAAAELFVRDDTYAATNYLVHRYGFAGDASDSIGGAHGTIADANVPNHSFADGQLILTNTGLNSRPTRPSTDPLYPNLQELLPQQGAYVDLPNGMISALGKTATFMIWFTYNSADTGNWPRLFDFGISTGGEGFSTGGDGVQWLNGVPYLDTAAEDTQEYIMLSPKRDAGPGWRYESLVRPPANSIIIDPTNNSTIAGGKEACIACVFDGVNRVMSLYVNGVLVGQNTNLTHDLANINDVNNWLGRSQWPDAMFTGKINEFRIYNIPLTKHWIKAYYEQGPDDYTTVPNPCIQDAPNPMDFNADCFVDFSDFVVFAAQWLDCDRLNGCGQ